MRRFNWPLVLLGIGSLILWALIAKLLLFLFRHLT
jgi:hypothetical protein